MAFRFKKNESVDNAVRRLCLDCLGKAVNYLRRGDPVKAVHDARKEIKKLRTVLRLIRKVIGDSVYREITDRLREAANHLATPRDAQVKQWAFEELARNFNRMRSAHQFDELRKKLGDNCTRETEKFWKKGSVRKVQNILRRLKKRVTELHVKPQGWSALRPGLKLCYQLGREAHKTARKNPSPENLHNWRKRVKELWHIYRLLAPIWPHKQCTTAPELEALGEHLGKDRDLALLKGLIVQESLKDTKRLEHLINKRQTALLSTAFESGARLYQEKPSAFCNSVEHSWRDWRNE